MKQEWNLIRVLQILFLTIAMIGIICIYPGNLFHTKNMVSVDTNEYQETDIASEEAGIMQQFIPSEESLHSITVMVDSLGGNTGLFKLRLYDQALNLLWEDGRRFNESPGIANYTFTVEQEVKAGQPYFYTLNYDSASFAACYTEREPAINSDNGTLYFNLQEIPNATLITEYEYRNAYSVKRILVYDGALLLIAGMLCGALEVIKRRKTFKSSILDKLDKKITSNGVFYAFTGTATAFCSVYVFWQIWINHMFSAYTIENTFLSLGVIITTVVLLYALSQMKLEKIMGPKELWRHMPNILQVIFWGMAILACCDFVNAGSNYAQGLAIRQMCIFFGLAVIAKFQKKELCNLWNAIYVVLACIAIILYSRMFWGQGEPFQTAVRTALMWAIAGMVLISTVLNLIHKKVAYFAPLFISFVGVFFALLLVFRNGNIWPIAIVIPFGLFYIRQFQMEEMDQILGNIANGILFSFVITSLQAFLHRPFHYYTMTRYSGVFMTVTVTAVYLSMIFAVALCKLIKNYEKEQTLKSIWKELLIIGMVCGYEFLTLSRTGMVSCAAVYIVACTIYFIFHFKQRIKPIRFICFTLIAILCGIPVAYTGSRILPAIVNRPTIYVGEEFQDSIRKGEPIDSFRYITIEKLIGKSAERMLGKTDLSFVTESGKTVAEVLESSKGTENENQAIQENGVTVNGDKLTYVDEYGSEYTIDNPDYSNGRLDIYKKYLSNLNLTGHATIGLPQEDGTIVVHAHNSFIQMAYDCGIITGIVFFVLYIVFGFRSVWYYQRRKDIDKYAMLPVIIFAAFGISSMVEYVFRPTIPLGFVFLLMLAPLIISPKKCEKKLTDAELEQK